MLSPPIPDWPGPPVKIHKLRPAGAVAGTRFTKTSMLRPKG
jgi:hypothetical protein